MDYVLIAAIMTFFILLYVLNIKEGYTDSYVNSTLESIKLVKGNVEKTLNNIKDLTGTNTGTTTTIDLMSTIEEIQSGLDSDSYKKINDVTRNSIINQKNNLLSIQNNVLSIRKKLKDVLDSVNVSIVPLNSTNQQTIPLLDAIKSITNDLNDITDYLNKIPDKSPDS
jgi:hypothetical protein